MAHIPVPTDCGCSGIDTVFDELFCHGAEVNDDLARLDLVHSAGLNGLDCGIRSHYSYRLEPKLPITIVVHRSVSLAALGRCKAVFTGLRQLAILTRRVI
jgi:hypothetical protein